MFQYDDESRGLIETHTTTTKPEIFQNDFVTLEKGERYHVNMVYINHEIYVDKVYVFVLVRELSESEVELFESFTG